MRSDRVTGTVSRPREKFLGRRVNKGLWVIRADRRSKAVQTFVSRSIIALALPPGTVTPDTSPSVGQLTSALKERFPDKTDFQLRILAVRVIRFLTEMDNGQQVALVDPDNHQLIMGVIASDPIFDPQSQSAFPIYRRVTWTGVVKKASLTRPTLNGLGAIQPLFRVSELATAELLEKTIQVSRIG